MDEDDEILDLWKIPDVEAFSGGFNSSTHQEESILRSKPQKTISQASEFWVRDDFSDRSSRQIDRTQGNSVKFSGESEEVPKVILSTEKDSSDKDPKLEHEKSVKSMVKSIDEASPLSTNKSIKDKLPPLVAIENALLIQTRKTDGVRYLFCESSSTSLPVTTASGSHSKPANLSDRLAAAIRIWSTQNSQPKPSLNLPWVLPSTLRYFQSVLLVSGVDQYGPLLVVKEIEKSKWKVKPRRKIDLRLSVYFESTDWVAARLLDLAEAIVVDDVERALELHADLGKFSDMRGTAMQRLAFYFLDGLKARGLGMTAEDYLKPVPFSLQELELVSKLLDRLPLLSHMSYVAYDLIAEATSKATIIHIVDVTCWTGSWTGLLRSFAETPHRNLSVKFTAVDPPPGHSWSLGPCIPGAFLKSQVMTLAAELGISVQFRVVTSDLGELTKKLLEISDGESLVVHALLCLQHLPDSAVLRSNPRDKFLKTVLSWRPKLLVVSNIDVDQNSPFFLYRMKESLRFYSAHFDLLENVASDSPRGRIVVEKGLFGKEILNSIACEGSNRVGRHERFSQWRERMIGIGMRPFPLNETTLKELRAQFSVIHPCFNVETEDQGLKLTWKGTSLCATHAWTC